MTTVSSGSDDKTFPHSAFFVYFLQGPLKSEAFLFVLLRRCSTVTPTSGLPTYLALQIGTTHLISWCPYQSARWMLGLFGLHVNNQANLCPGGDSTLITQCKHVISFLCGKEQHTQHPRVLSKIRMQDIGK